MIRPRALRIGPPQATIRKVGDKWVLFTKDGKRRLGTHDTRKDAEKQERLIEKKKHEEEES